MNASNDDLYPLALLMDELKHDDVANRVEAMQKLDTIAIALGPERTLKELLPFLHEVAQDDEEEVFAVLATKLGDFIPLIGGPEHCESLIEILVILASMEEPIVREKAINSLTKISTELSNEKLTSIYLPLIHLLSQGNWFSKKIASCGLFKTVIVKVNADVRRELLTVYYKLICDDSPMVRRAAATNLPVLIDEMTEFTEKHPNSTDKINNKDWELISQSFQHLVNDEQDSVKFLSIDVLASTLDFFRKTNDHSHDSEFLISFLKLVGDESWRVRYTAAIKFNKIAKNFADDESNLSKLIDPFIALMNDNESEVRRAVAKELPQFCEFLSKFKSTNEPILERIIPVVNKLSQDPQETVRASLALSITNLSPILGKQATIDNLLPIFLVMLKEEYPDVRLNIISNLSVVNDIIGINLLSTNLLPAITELAQDSKWRVRLAIIEYIPKLAKQLGVSFFNSELLSLCMSWLWDPVFAIRDAVVNILKELSLVFGSDWTNEEIINRLLNDKKETSNNPDDLEDVKEAGEIDYSNFTTRITCIFAITNLIPAVKPDVLIDRLLPFLDKFIDDPVPNIRFNIAKSYLVAAEKLLESDSSSAHYDNIINNHILPNLERLKNDEDVDVRYYAEKSIEGIQEDRK